MSKAIFVDGRSLSNMELNFETKFQYRVLYRILQEEIGTQKVVSHTTYTLSRSAGRVIVGHIQSAGFKTIFADSSGSQDDQIILRAIRALDVSVVTEVVLVSSDSDYMFALKELVQKGIKVYWVATRYVRPGIEANRSLSLKLEPFFQDNTFTFVEIGDFLTKLKPPTYKSDPAKRTGIAFVLRQMDDVEQNQRLQAAVTELLSTFPNLKAEVIHPLLAVTNIPGRMLQLRGKNSTVNPDSTSIDPNSGK